MSELPATTASLSSIDIPLPSAAPEAVPPLASPLPPSAQHKAIRFGNLEPVALTVAKRSTLPITAIVMLALCVLVGGRSLSLQFWALALVTFLISSQILSPLDIPNQVPAGRTRKDAPRILLEWSCIAAILAFLGIEFNVHALPRDVLVAWYATTPIAMLLVGRLSVPLVRWLAADHSAAERYIIIGANEVGLELARRIAQMPSRRQRSLASSITASAGRLTEPAQSTP